MKISGLKLHSIAIADPPLRSSYGLHAPWALRTIVELETDDGIRGVSETYGGEAPRAALEAMRPRLLGMDPFRLAGLLEEMNRESAAYTNVAGCVPGDRSQTWLVAGGRIEFDKGCVSVPDRPGFVWNSITTNSRAPRSVTRKFPFASATTKQKCANM